MAIALEDLSALLAAGFPNADVRIKDLNGDQNHYGVMIITPAFAGKSRIERHKMVYAALDGRAGTEIHAISVRAMVPEEFELFKQTQSQE